MAGKNKGNSFEREICTSLSKWWTDGERDDVFWRTASSGGRATQRGRKGKQTKNHCGDICATDPTGQPLLDVITFELKRGYSKDTIADLLDKPVGAARQTYEKWIAQAIESQSHAGTYSWVIIVKRDRRDAIVIMPSSLRIAMSYTVSFTPHMVFSVLDPNVGGITVDCMKLSTFLLITDRNAIEKITNAKKKRA